MRNNLSISYIFIPGTSKGDEITLQPCPPDLQISSMSCCTFFWLLCITFSVMIIPALVWISYTKHGHLGDTVVRKAACGQDASSQPGSRLIE